MKKFSLLLLCLSFSLQAAPVDELVDTLAGPKSIERIHRQLNRYLISQNSALADYQDVLDSWSQQHITWSNLAPEFKELYAKYFSDAEIKELLAFYKSPVGQKSLAVSEQISREGAAASLKLAKQYEEQLKTMLVEERSRREGTATN
ncbi:DUF2059 domain-containing protein [Aliagarivorans taiwanensis]|uniref:DUF2059 domain-containing protein n=1 Tax=Aliagarivorans taiwanensis TaxID=561966 RepID=UPI000417FD7A|nr:DUF2059 domain-containing protein [Aliagarivorans taiwanensis]